MKLRADRPKRDGQTKVHLAYSSAEFTVMQVYASRIVALTRLIWRVTVATETLLCMASRDKTTI